MERDEIVNACLQKLYKDDYVFVGDYVSELLNNDLDNTYIEIMDILESKNFAKRTGNYTQMKITENGKQVFENNSYSSYKNAQRNKKIFKNFKKEIKNVIPIISVIIVTILGILNYLNDRTIKNLKIKIEKQERIIDTLKQE